MQRAGSRAARLLSILRAASQGCFLHEIAERQSRIGMRSAQLSLL
jgi:hypothetical protein